MSTHRPVQERSPADDGRPERATTASGPLTELLETAAETLGGHAALVCGDERIGYDELAERVARLAHGLAGRGVSPGDPVALVMRDTPAFVVSFLAVAGLQGRVVPLNPRGATPTIVKDWPLMTIVSLRTAGFAPSRDAQ